MRKWAEVNTSHGLAGAVILLCLVLAACTGGDRTGPVDIRWDQQSCERCAMSVGERLYAAQVRGAPAGEKTRIFTFDDLGCAVIWLDKQPWKQDPRTEVWVTDAHSGAWLDARQASFQTGHHTPMGYGLGAGSSAQNGALSFNEARDHILAVDRDRGHNHGDNHKHGGDES